MFFKKRIEGLEKALNLVSVLARQDHITYFTYSQNGKKYLALQCITNGGVNWSKHFIVEDVAKDRGINAEIIDDEALFEELSHF